MHPRTVAIAGALCLAIGWGVGVQVARQGQPPAPGRPSGPRPLGVGDRPAAPLAEDLRLKLDRSPAPPRPGRNPFRFAAPRAPLARPRADAPEGSVEAGREASAAAPATPPPGALFLAGIATETGEAGPIHTAIINDGGRLVFASLGDQVTDGLTVAGIDDLTVTLRDQSGRERTLRLR